MDGWVVEGSVMVGDENEKEVQRSAYLLFWQRILAGCINENFVQFKSKTNGGTTKKNSKKKGAR